MKEANEIMFDRCRTCYESYLYRPVEAIDSSRHSRSHIHTTMLDPANKSTKLPTSPCFTSRRQSQPAVATAACAIITKPAISAPLALSTPRNPSSIKLRLAIQTPSNANMTPAPTPHTRIPMV